MYDYNIIKILKKHLQHMFASYNLYILEITLFEILINNFKLYINNKI